MTNNDLFRRMRFIFDYSDQKMVSLFENVEVTVSKEQVITWLKKDEDPNQQPLYDRELAAFLNGFIIEKRGKRADGEIPLIEKSLNNNQVLRKLKIALNLKSEDIIQILALVKLRIGKAELSALFRASDHRHYRACKDQFLRNFVYGLRKSYRPDETLTNENS